MAAFTGLPTRGGNGRAWKRMLDRVVRPGVDRLGRGRNRPPSVEGCAARIEPKRSRGRRRASRRRAPRPGSCARPPRLSGHLGDRPAGALIARDQQAGGVEVARPGRLPGGVTRRKAGKSHSPGTSCGGWRTKIPRGSRRDAQRRDASSVETGGRSRTGPAARRAAGGTARPPRQPRPRAPGSPQTGRQHRRSRSASDQRVDGREARARSRCRPSLHRAAEPGAGQGAVRQPAGWPHGSGCRAKPGKASSGRMMTWRRRMPSMRALISAADSSPLGMDSMGDLTLDGRRTRRAPVTYRSAERLQVCRTCFSVGEG